MSFSAPGTNQTYQLFQYANTVTSGWFGVGTLFTMWITIFLMLQVHGVKKAFTSASFLTMIFAILFRVIELVNDWVVYLFIIATGLSVLGHFIEKTGVYD